MDTIGNNWCDLDRLYRKSEQIPPMEFQQYAQSKTTYSQAIKASSWIRNILLHEVIIYLGVECNIMDLEMGETAIQNTRRLVLAMINASMSLHYDFLLVPDAK
jgi:hypothetical protein